MEELVKLREEINRVDEEIVKLLRKRLEIVEKILEIKKKYKLPIYDSKREEEVINRWKEKGRELGIPEEIVERIVRCIVETFRNYQQRK